MGVDVPFSFEGVITSHGWRDLAPNRWRPETGRFERPVRLSDGRVVRATVSPREEALGLTVEGPESLDSGDLAEVRGAVDRMFRLSEDLQPFYRRCRERGGRWGGLAKGQGRLLRSPTVFEDVVKTICTTNVAWSGTRRMVEALVREFGSAPGAYGSLRAFPTAETIASVDADALREAAGLGYRAPYVHAFARRVAAGDLDPESWIADSANAEALYDRIRSVKGVGDYAASTLMMLVGHYGRLPVDSVYREFVGERYFDGTIPSGTDPREVYEAWGAWKYLAYWSELAGWVARKENPESAPGAG